MYICQDTLPEQYVHLSHYINLAVCTPVTLHKLSSVYLCYVTLTEQYVHLSRYIN